jgi:enoyl-[acyl-carrier-protein] reductase (NADH)
MEYLRHLPNDYKAGVAETGNDFHTVSATVDLESPSRFDDQLKELARHGIRVNALAPGYIRTALNEAFLSGEAGQKLMKRIPQRRFGEMADLDGPLLLLASVASAAMTESVANIDGGHLANAL